MAKIFAEKYEIVDQPKSANEVDAFTARDSDNDEIVTVTVYRGDDQEVRGAFIQEAQLLQSLEHPNILALRHRGIHEGQPYFVTDSVHFATLSDWCSTTVDLERQLNALADLASALEHAHEKDIIHRNLNPAIVLLDRDGQVHLSGWGRSRSQKASKDLTKTGMIVGTPEYLSPEYIREGVTSKASDIYSFGALAYALLSGEPPFTGELNEVLKGHLFREPCPLNTLRQEVDEATSAFINELLTKDADKRPTSMATISRRFRRFARGSSNVGNILLESSSSNVQLNRSSANETPKSFSDGVTLVPAFGRATPVTKNLKKPAAVLISLLLFILILVMTREPQNTTGTVSPTEASPQEHSREDTLKRQRLQEEYKVYLREFFLEPRIRASNPQLRNPDELLRAKWLHETVLLALEKELKATKTANVEKLHSLCKCWVGTLDLLLRLPPLDEDGEKELGQLTLSTMVFGLFDLCWRSFIDTPLDKAWDLAKLGDREHRDATLEGDNQLCRLYILNFPWVQDRKLVAQEFLAKESKRLWQREDETLKSGRRKPLNYTYQIIRKVTEFIVGYKARKAATQAVEKLVYNSRKRTLKERMCTIFIATFLVHAEDYIDNEERMGRIRNLAKEARRLVPGWVGEGEPPYNVKMALFCQRLWLRRMWVFSEHMFANHLGEAVLNRNRQEAAMLVHTVINKFSGKGALDYFHRPVLRRIVYHDVKGSVPLQEYLAAEIKRIEVH